MKFLLTLLIGISCQSIVAQDKEGCNVAVYLVKNRAYNHDTVTNKWLPFTVTMQDLEDTAFIKNEEIASYSFTKAVSKYQGGKDTWVFHRLHTSVSLTERIEKLNLPISFCAEQFAIVCDGEVIYAGCLNSRYSSHVPSTVFATANEKELLLSLIPGIATTDPRENEKLFSCLKKTNRFRFFKKKRKQR